MRHRAVLEGVVTLVVFAHVFVQPAQGDGSKTTMYQRLSEQAIKTEQSRRIAQAVGSSCLLRTVDRLLGWEGDVVAAFYPGEFLLYDQILDNMIENPLAGPDGLRYRAQTPESVIIHLTYGADCEAPLYTLLAGKDEQAARAEISPLSYVPYARWVRQVDPAIHRTRADVYATLRVRDKDTQREGRLFLFLSLSLTERGRGRFQWDQIARTQQVVFGAEKGRAEKGTSLNSRN